MTHRFDPARAYLRRIINDVNRDKRFEAYRDKGRLIEPADWAELKRAKKCGHCGNCFNGKKRPEIHHIKPVSEGGGNERANLLAVHGSCHKKIHEEFERKKQEEKRNAGSPV